MKKQDIEQQLRQQLHDMRAELNQMREANQQMQLAVDSVLAQLILTIAPEGMELTIPKPQVETLSQYKVAAVKDGDNYTISLIERTVE